MELIQAIKKSDLKTIPLEGSRKREEEIIARK
jgi:hypothetical protein